MKRRMSRWAVVLLGLTLAWATVGCRTPETGLAPTTSPAVAVGTDLVYGPYVTAVSPEGASVHWITAPGAKVSCQFQGDSAGATVKLTTASIPGCRDVRHTALVT